MQDKINKFNENLARTLITLPESEYPLAVFILGTVNKLFETNIYKVSEHLEIRLLFSFHSFINICQDDKKSESLKKLTQEALLIITELFPKQYKALINLILMMSILTSFTGYQLSQNMPDIQNSNIALAILISIMSYPISMGLEKNPFSFDLPTEDDNKNDNKQTDSTISSQPKSEIAKSIGDLMSQVTKDQQQAFAKIHIAQLD